MVRNKNSSAAAFMDESVVDETGSRDVNPKNCTVKSLLFTLR